MVRAEMMDLILILPNVGKSVSMMSALLESTFSVACGGMQLTNNANANRTINDNGFISLFSKFFFKFFSKKFLIKKKKLNIRNKENYKYIRVLDRAFLYVL